MLVTEAKRDGVVPRSGGHRSRRGFQIPASTNIEPLCRAGNRVIRKQGADESPETRCDEEQRRKE